MKQRAMVLECACFCFPCLTCAQIGGMGEEIGTVLASNELSRLEAQKGVWRMYSNSLNRRELQEFLHFGDGVSGRAVLPSLQPHTVYYSVSVKMDAFVLSLLALQSIPRAMTGSVKIEVEYKERRYSFECQSVCSSRCLFALCANVDFLYYFDL